MRADHGEAPQFVVRVRRGLVEVEVRGTETFVREMSSDLFDQYLVDDGAVEARDYEVVEEPARPRQGVPAVSVQGQQLLFAPNPVMPPLAMTFRDMLNGAGNPSAAERVLMAGYFLMAEGNEGFDAASAAELFTTAYESKPNFSREFERAAKLGWITRTRSNDPRRFTFRLTHRGIEHVRQLMNAKEPV